MLKLLPAGAGGFENIRCGEVYCVSASSYTVACCLCANKVLFEEFPAHFQEHWTRSDDKSIKGVTTRTTRSRRNEEKQHLQLDCEATKDSIKTEKCEDEQLGCMGTLFTIEKSEEAEQDFIDEPLIDLEDLQILPIKQQVKESLLGDSEDEPDEDAQPNIDTDLEDDKDSDWNNDGPNSNGDSSVEETEADPKTKEVASSPIPCPKCERTYKTKRSLAYHLRVNHNPERRSKKNKAVFKCTECEDVFGSERLLRGHKWKHTGIFCDICGKTFTQAGNMMRHKIRHTGIKAHKCEECGNCFYTDKELRAHMLRHTGIMPIICEICGKRCRDRGVLTAHMRRHTGERPAKCQVCGKSFYSFHDLNVHAVAHTSERPFACDICGSTFQRKKALRVHKKLHNKERNHVCKICGKSFMQSSGLTAHMRTHDAAINRSISVAIAVPAPELAMDMPRTEANVEIETEFLPL